ncbi:MAG: MBL fold metallo-hydrolase, partial [Candidatus Heimdallarchaeota archaeon]
MKSRNTRNFLDFGKNFSIERNFFEFPVLRPANLHDLLKLELIPDFKGLYRFDESRPLINGIFLTHAHLDHYGYIPCLRKDTNIFLGACTKRLLDLRSHMSPSTWDTKLEHLKFTLFQTNDEISVTDDIVIRPIHVDHSVPGAYGFIIHIENKTLVYTGDLRFHGFASPLTADFLDRVAKEEVDILLCEGTNVQSNAQTPNNAAKWSLTLEPSKDRIELEKLKTEKEVLDKLILISDNTEGLILYDMTLTDIDRLRTVWQAAEKTGRRVLYDSRQAFLLLFLNAEKKFVSNLPKKGDFDIYLDRLKKRRETGVRLIFVRKFFY